MRHSGNALLTSNPFGHIHGGRQRRQREHRRYEQAEHKPRGAQEPVAHRNLKGVDSGGREARSGSGHGEVLTVVFLAGVRGERLGLELWMVRAWGEGFRG